MTDLEGVEWIDLRGYKDYLLLKKPIRVERTPDNFYVKAFDVSFPLEYNLKQIKEGLVEIYKTFLDAAANDKLSESNEKKWDKILEYVDYDGMWHLLASPMRNIVELVEKEGRRLIKVGLTDDREEFEVRNKLKNYLKTLPLGYYMMTITFSKNKIVNLDEIVFESEFTKEFTKISEEYQEKKDI